MVSAQYERQPGEEGAATVLHFSEEEAEAQKGFRTW
jgi:hypothetical protein